MKSTKITCHTNPETGELYFRIEAPPEKISIVGENLKKEILHVPSSTDTDEDQLMGWIQTWKDKPSHNHHVCVLLKINDMVLPLFGWWEENENLWYVYLSKECGTSFDEDMVIGWKEIDQNLPEEERFEKPMEEK